MQNQYSLTLLASDTTIPAFDCGNADINDFLTDDTRLMYFDLKPFKDAL